MSDFIRTIKNVNNFSYTKMPSNFLMKLIKISQDQLDESISDKKNDMRHQEGHQEVPGNNQFLVKIYDLIEKEYKCLEKKTTRFPLLIPCKKFYFISIFIILVKKMITR